MTTIRCQAMLFDMDGVLVFSMGAVERVWSKWAVAHGFDPKVVVHAAHGRPSVETVREFLPHGDSHAENLQIERGEIEDLEGVVAVPGALALLNSLPADRWIVATSATLALAEVRLRAAGIPVLPNMITSGDIQRGKPDPEPYLKAAARLGFPASECVVVEDAIAGIRAGKAAGARVIALPTSSERGELERAGADWVVRDCTDIAAIVDGSRLLLSLNT
jgi:mannitol-1-/sugar-/sorbitol-6-phosphatase